VIAIVARQRHRSVSAGHAIRQPERAAADAGAMRQRQRLLGQQRGESRKRLAQVECQGHALRADCLDQPAEDANRLGERGFVHTGRQRAL